MLKERYEAVVCEVRLAAEAADRPAESVTLIAVGKTHPAEAIQEVYDLGHRDFGENKVQELTEKYECLPKDIRWHFIGHLQRNKVKYLMGKTALIHSLDSVKLARKIESESLKKDVHTDVLIQVNICDEEQKFGVSIAALPALLQFCESCERLHVQGLMLIPPFDLSNTELERVFNEFYALSLDIKRQKLDNINMNVLSFGMSGDFPEAIRHHSTMVRVGTGIFGERDYNN
ncbi:MAG: YggS family pyridoxal phosphate-dependent enzyme [Eubacteriales bacterium]|nr:YggS family pyridoxal phosphate-dependent enzyme [Eubacteriales bacterium]